MRTAILLGLAAAVGCTQTTPRFPAPPPHVEEFVTPPDESRFNQAPEQGYRKPPPKKEFKPGMGGGMPGMGGMGGGMPGGMPGQ